MTPSLGEIVERLERRLDVIDGDVFEAPVGDASSIALPGAVEARGDELERARQLLERIHATEARVEGTRLRLLGEIASFKRPTSSSYRAPRFVDTEA